MFDIYDYDMQTLLQRKHRKSPADLFRRQDKKKTERGRNWHDSKQP
jgi:hypothetical protein